MPKTPTTKIELMRRRASANFVIPKTSDTNSELSLCMSRPDISPSRERMENPSDASEFNNLDGRAFEPRPGDDRVASVKTASATLNGDPHVRRFMSPDHPVTPRLLDGLRRLHLMSKRILDTSMNSSAWAYSYAEMADTRRPEVEATLLRLDDPYWILSYAEDFLGESRWPEAEPIIAKDPDAAAAYAKYTLKRPWLEA